MRTALSATALLTTGFITPIATTGPAGAAGTACAFSASVDLTPGLSAQPGTGTFTTNGPTGTIDCGESSGTLGFEGKYGTKDPDSCAGAFYNGNEGDGSFVLSTPGTGTVEGTFTFVYGTLSSNGGVVEGTFQGEKISGTFQLSPTAGDCFSSPISQGRITGQGMLS